MPPVPGLESFGGVFRERAAVVDLQHLVHDEFHGAQAECEIHQRGHRRGHGAHGVGVGEHRVAQRRSSFGIFYPGRLYDVADLHIVGACHLAALAVEAVFQRLIVEIRAFEAVALAVRTGLFRPRVVGVDGRDRTIDRAYGAFDTRLEIVVAYVLLLEVHHGCCFLRVVGRVASREGGQTIREAALRAVARVIPAPHPSFRALKPASRAPVA